MPRSIGSGEVKPWLGDGPRHRTSWPLGGSELGSGMATGPSDQVGPGSRSPNAFLYISVRFDKFIRCGRELIGLRKIPPRFFWCGPAIHLGT